MSDPEAQENRRTTRRRQRENEPYAGAHRSAEVEEIAARLARLESIVEIQELMYTYAECVDRARFAELTARGEVPPAKRMCCIRPGKNVKVSTPLEISCGASSTRDVT